MGNCLDICKGGASADATAPGASHQNEKKQHGWDKTPAAKKPSSDGNRSKVHSLHEGLLHQQTSDVYGKYEEVEVLGTGSMGHVARVKIKDSLEGRSTYRASSSGSSSDENNDKQRTSQIVPRKTNSSISDRRKVEYALKSIQLERVSPTFIDELNNEIDILKTMDHPNIVRLHEVYYQKNKQIYLILELCDGGDLYTRLPYTGESLFRCEVGG